MRMKRLVEQAGEVSAWSITPRDVVALLNNELEDTKIEEYDITPAMVQKIANAYGQAFAVWIEENGIAYKGLRAPSDVWDVVEDIVRDIEGGL